MQEGEEYLTNAIVMIFTRKHIAFTKARKL